jgi:methionyl aminopeptidase
MRAQSGIGDLVHLKDEQWLARQKVAGKAVGECLRMAHDRVSSQESGLTGKVLERDCVEILNKYDCIPTFKDYHGFPGAICYSVNKEMVHGIPNDKLLNPGDLVTVDLGATFEGAIADAAVTAIYGSALDAEHIRMLRICQNSLHNAIKEIKLGRKIGVIGRSIYKTVKDSGFNLITNYGGHGISTNQPHASPFVANKSGKDDGITIFPGLSIAIEPMISMVDAKTQTLEDNWTVVTGGLNCHFEHSVTVMEDKVHVITQWEDYELV